MTRQFFNESLEPTCESRVEELPRFARAKNAFGKWVYLVEAAGKLRQHVQVKGQGRYFCPHTLCLYKPVTVVDSLGRAISP